ncbi:gamma-glutamylcyclotransferase [Cochlodiniinecator piscidefendens]|uniref:gamma-glutamylcyclotransferase n=1 Tax=Cochlodiniinecator piscidefendens TaxID=2715756 RepID=UPI00140C1C3F|nr:gamma-glutamylcyclotransferase [Cochlodiniinecator piscidefendens]
MGTAPFWVFGYGSLVWNPGFPYKDRQIARLDGFHRSFCMLSIHHRGSEEEPGLVLALDKVRDGYCDGVAFYVGEEDAEETLQALRERELISSAYLEAELPLTFRDGREVQAVTYIMDPNHVQYCGGMSLEKQAEIIAKAVGGRGPNTEYLYNTAEHLEEIGLKDDDLHWLMERVRELTK